MKARIYMATFFLMMIYLAFISLGLPDSLLGSAWPIMHESLAVPLGSAGLISMITAGGTIVSSLLSGKVIRRFGTGKVTFISVFLTSMALFGFSLSPNIYFLMIMAIPLGLGAGSIDSALNNFVALHYKARHMSWLHSFWGVGATLGPIIMSSFLIKGESWRNGYRTVALIQFILFLVLFATLPLWKKYDTPEEGKGAQRDKDEIERFENPYKIPGVKYALFTFFAYCAIESTTGLWGSTYLVESRGIAPEIAARFISLYYGGITVGRFITGFITMKFPTRTILRAGILIILSGVLCIALPLPGFMAILGLVLIGLGCAPVFPGMIHETPTRFGAANSQSVIGIQMAFAYVGSTFMPAFFGLLGGEGNIFIFPYYLLILVSVLLFGTERINSMMKARHRLKILSAKEDVI